MQLFSLIIQHILCNKITKKKNFWFVTSCNCSVYCIQNEMEKLEVNKKNKEETQEGNPIIIIKIKKETFTFKIITNGINPEGKCLDAWYSLTACWYSNRLIRNCWSKTSWFSKTTSFSFFFFFLSSALRTYSIVVKHNLRFIF